jgi:DNA-3-methyladenine glycosylase II
MSQQLSTKVASVIYGRFLALFGDVLPEPGDIAAKPYSELRSIGLSHAKATYVHNVAQYFLEHGLTDAQLMAMNDDEVRHSLLPIKGVGRWTVEMLLMFALGREDVFAPDDLGIQQAMIHLYGLDSTNKKQLAKHMNERAMQWSPYRTWACFYLWRYKDSGIVAGM